MGSSTALQAASASAHQVSHGTTAPHHRFFTQREAAGLLNITVAKIEQLRWEGRIRYLPGKPILFEIGDLIDLNADLKTPKTKADIERDAIDWVQRRLAWRRIRSLRQ